MRDKNVVEVGCDDGRLTWRYAALARSVLALDPNETRIAPGHRGDAGGPDADAHLPRG